MADHLSQVPGRQCLASAALLGSRPEEALPLLESIAEVSIECTKVRTAGMAWP